MSRLRPGVTVDETDEGLRFRDAATQNSFVLETPPERKQALHGFLQTLRRKAVPPEERPATVTSDEYDELMELLATYELLDGVKDERALRQQQNARVRAEEAAEDFERLRSLLQYWCKKLPYYRDRLRSVGLAAEDVRTREEFERIPVMTKADVRANFPHNLVIEDEYHAELKRLGLLFLNSTSGTSDERLQALFDATTNWLPVEQLHRLWNVARYPEATVAFFTTPICSGNQCTLGETPLEKRLGLRTYLYTVPDLFKAKPEHVRAILHELNEAWPKFLVVHPTYAAWLAKQCRALSLPLYRPRVVLTCYQFATRPERHELRESFQASVFSHYGATEVGGAVAGGECVEGRMHRLKEYAHVEVTRGGVPTAPGELGMVTLTTLSNKVMPLVRYQLGDVGRDVDEVCSCPAGGTSSLFHLDGRLKDSVWHPDGRLLTTAQVDAATEGLSTVCTYRFVQAEPARYVFELVPRDERVSKEDLERLGAASRELLGPKAAVEVKEVEALPLERSKKLRVTQSQARPPPETL